MRPCFIILLAAAVVLSLGTSVVPAQDRPTHPVLYRLETGSTFQQGCFPPCMCPLMQEQPLHGTFRLVYTGSDWLFDNFDVQGIKWKTEVAGTPTWIRGSGTYRRGGEFVVEDYLELDLAVGNTSPQHFSSGPLRHGANGVFHRIDISISLHGEYCLDTVMHLDARPARRLHVDRNGLVWDPEPWPSFYDVVTGDLSELRASEGAFDLATRACLAAGLGQPALSFDGIPGTGQAFWFLVRPDGETYDDADSGQVGSADEGIVLSLAACP